MNYGKTVSLFLTTGNPNGIICSYLSNWTGQVLKIPRNFIKEAKDRKELKKQGVYFLIGNNDELNNEKNIYVGESENIYERLINHLKEGKEFWNYAVTASSKDEDLTKAHAKYLEYEIINLIKNNSEYNLMNKNSGTTTILPEMSIATMEEYLENLKIILSTMGYNLFEATNNNDEKIFNLKNAYGIITENGEFIVLKDSQISLETKSSLSNNYKFLRDSLIERGIIDKETYKFIKNYEFTSPSAAAAIIVGTSINGRRVWKFNGKSLDELEKENL